MREKQFGLQARRFDAFFGQKIRALLDCFKNRHADNLNRSDTLEQAARDCQNQVMNVRIKMFPVALGLAVFGTACGADNTKSAGDKTMNIQIISVAFAGGQPIPAKYTCDGQDVSPPLKWSNAPANTKSFALIADDPDAPGGTWVHWVLYDLPATTTELAENTPKSQQLPGGAKQGLNSWPRLGYGGPCPPRGKPHRYFFKLYALDTLLDLKPGATKKDLLKAMEGHVLGEGQLMGTYQRK
jgi:Raf kinase inhibitor-like YbhB/YbcL family protein